MMEPLFIEFADECMKIVEPEKPNDGWFQLNVYNFFRAGDKIYGF